MELISNRDQIGPNLADGRKIWAVRVTCSVPGTDPLGTWHQQIFYYERASPNLACIGEHRFHDIRNIETARVLPDGMVCWLDQ